SHSKRCAKIAGVQPPELRKIPTIRIVEPRSDFRLQRVAKLSGKEALLIQSLLVRADEGHRANGNVMRIFGRNRSTMQSAKIAADASKNGRFDRRLPPGGNQHS